MAQAEAQPSNDPPADEGPADPLAAMMAPPSRAPSALRRPGGGAGATPGRFPPGMRPPMPPGAATPAGRPPAAPGAPPSFAVFTPKPAAKKEDES